MRKAIIDLGTNTFNLLIGEVIDGKLSILHTEKEAVMLGMGGINEGYISPEAHERAFKTLTRFKKRANKFQVSSIKGFGTSAIRAASNGRQFVDDVRQNLGIEIGIITGEGEAKLIYQGVSLTHSLSEDSIIMDIGGGSTEFVLANNTGFLQMCSLDIGVSRIFQKIGQPENYSVTQINSIIRFFNEKKGAFFNEVKANVLIGASGSFETFYEIIYNQKIDSEIASKIEFTKLLETLDWVINSTLDERMNNEWIVPLRKRMLPIAALKVKWTIEELGIKEVFVSPYSLKEGAFIE